MAPFPSFSNYFIALCVSHHTPIIPPSYPPGRTDTSSPKGNTQAHTHTHIHTHTSPPFLDIDMQQNTFIHLLSHSYIHKLTHAYSSTHSLHPPLSSSISSPLSPSLSLPPFHASSSSSPPLSLVQARVPLVLYRREGRGEQRGADRAAKPYRRHRRGRRGR